MAASDILYVRYQLADLTAAAGFMEDFGLVRVVAEPGVLRMRGALGVGPFMYEAIEGGTNQFLGFGMRVDERAELLHLADLPDAGPVEPLGDGLAGERVRMRMPDGFTIDAVYGADLPSALPLRAPNAFNAGQRKLRTNANVRQAAGVVPALRLGHVVLHVSDHGASVAWLRDRFGLMASDHLAPPGQPQHIVGTFMRVDRGQELVDHHCVFILQSSQVGVHHCSFEVQDLDHLMAAHDFLLARGYELDCGVGRHMLGSQIYDYWRDPAGFRVEHYTDGDVVNHRHAPSVFCGTADETTQWGDRPDKTFFD